MPNAVGSREQTYLIAKDAAVSPAGAGPLDFEWVVEQLHADPVIDVQRTLQPRNVGLLEFGPSVVQTVVVASMPDEKAAELRGHPQIVLEPDHLVFPQPGPLPDPPPPPTDPGLVSPFGETTSWQISLQSAAGEPVRNASVYLYGRGVPVQGTTDAQGLVTLGLMGETDATLQALYVNPQSGYWSMWLTRPALTSGKLNTVVMHRLSDTFPGFPEQQLLGWGQKAMRLDQVPAGMTGSGVRVAVVDSGAAVRTHPDLAAIHEGSDFAGGPADGSGWADDVIAHGSHCSGVIAGADSASGIRGFAPGAEVLEARIFPGGRVSSLLDAIDYCMAQGVHVVNMSLGTGGTSQIFLQKLAQAREQGVACIVAAGNSGDDVQFPGSSPDVLTVAAIGQEGTFPEDSYHAQQRWRGGKEDQGLFSAQFSCHGPKIDVAGPGVAIPSSVPPDGYASWDGTSMATPHVIGLAALVLAHHPDFRTPAYSLPTSARVDRLFQLLKGSCRALDVGDPNRVGAGLPDALRALGLEGAPAGAATGTAAGTATGVAGAGGPEQATQEAAIAAALDQLSKEMAAAGLLVDVQVASATPPAAAEPSAMDIDRELALLRARMVAAGLAV